MKTGMAAGKVRSVFDLQNSRAPKMRNSPAPSWRLASIGSSATDEAT
ncbi:MAG TPA: hypothetical protein VKV40_03515 [Ktedonobacteraceae bacterium]|nr:hypothetical protein [Ktedonobacteraceae bacterium]